jgi:hypothetical protein
MDKEIKKELKKLNDSVLTIAEILEEIKEILRPNEDD